MSSLNSGLYSTGRILRSMAMAGSAPKFTGVMNRSQVPYGGILLTAAVCVLGVGLNYLVPDEAFEIVLNFASIGILATWGDHRREPPAVRPQDASAESSPARPSGCRSRRGPRSRRSCSWRRS